MTDFVRKNRPQTLDQPSLILSLVYVGRWGSETNREVVSVRSHAHTHGLVVRSELGKNDFYDLSMMFLPNDTNLLSTQGIINKTCILDPIEFWWVT